MMAMNGITSTFVSKGENHDSSKCKAVISRARQVKVLVMASIRYELAKFQPHGGEQAQVVEQREHPDKTCKMERSEHFGLDCCTGESRSDCAEHLVLDTWVQNRGIDCVEGRLNED